MITPDEVLRFWLAPDGTFRDVWFAKNALFDGACTGFADTLHAAKQGALDHWMKTPRGALALVVVLDQFSRNSFRGSSEAYAADAKARAVARAAIDRGFDQAVPPVARIFLYLPFEHSESLDDQRQQRGVGNAQPVSPERKDCPDEEQRDDDFEQRHGAEL